jgi:hypothetical protein
MAESGGKPAEAFKIDPARSPFYHWVIQAKGLLGLIVSDLSFFE